ncbi:MAG: UDP-N-acetylmuramoyl-L-alanine--D-glutamate ligase [Candidatus Hydrogenedentota bacterium]
MELQNQKVTIIGMGRTSLALSRLVLHHGGNPFISERRRREECSDFCRELDALGIAYECGGHSDVALSDAALLIPSPGVPYEHYLCTIARDKNIPVFSELELASRFVSSTVIAVTGTNGKTTTTELIAHLLPSIGKSVALAGNNDMPCSEVALLESQPKYLVLEVSSYQLEGTQTFRPDIAVVLNLSNDHLGRHKTMENYAAVKARLLQYQTAEDVAILNADDSVVLAMAENVSASILTFGASSECAVAIVDDTLRVNGVEMAHRSDSPLPGRHNSENILAAVAVLSVVGVEKDALQRGLGSFRGVEHRIEAVRELDGIAFYNDSKATNLDSLRVALESFDRPIVLIVGGEGKGSDYASLGALIHSRVSCVVAIGTDAPLIDEAWSPTVPVFRARSMNDAVVCAHEQANTGDTVLLSPACASFDMYANFEERGKDFKRCVTALTPTRTVHGANS